MSRHQFLHILVLVGVIAFANGEKSAFPGCRILQFGKKLQCRGVGLSEIPKIPRGILIADFADNLITHISQEDLKHLEKLEKVYMKGNPFHCDCNLEHLRLKLIGNNSPAIQDGESIKCSTPLQIHNKALKSLSDLCDITAENKLSRPSSSIQKRNAKAHVNECEKPNICPRYAICTKTNSSYECNCKEGYRNTTDGCEDINECKTGANKCDKTTSKCQNTNGGHYCMCLKGFNKIQDKCVDFDECKENSEICGDESTICNNTVGSYECICKKKGYGYNHVARRCLDIDECLKGPCDKSMVCQNSQGSYSCDCKPHYRKDGKVCKDIDECADKNTQLCEGDLKCFNTPGSFKCECDHGFLPDAYKKCKDLDECKVRKHNCSKQSYCRNTPGSFKCECPKGYKGNGIKCNPTKLTRFITPKYLLKDLTKGAWDTILVVFSAGVVAISLLVIIILMLRKMCKKCCGKKEFAYQDQLFYTEEMYDPDQMFFTEGEQMFYPDEMGYYPGAGEEMFYPEGMDYPEDTDYPEETGNPDEMDYEGDVADPIPMETVDPSRSVPHTYYGDDQDDELSDDYAEGVTYEY